MATPKRPATSPPRITPVEVGVESMRRATPRRRVRIRSAAPASEVRNMNSTSSWPAPRSKVPRFSKSSNSDSPAWV